MQPQLSFADGLDHAASYLNASAYGKAPPSGGCGETDSLGLDAVEHLGSSFAVISEVAEGSLWLSYPHTQFLHLKT